MSNLKLLLSLHDVTPRHFVRLTRAEALFRELGVTQVTYLLVPRYHRGWAIERNPQFMIWCAEPRPFTVRWCLHGYYHEETRPADWLSASNWFKGRFLTSGEGEFLDLGEADMTDRLDRGRKAFRACLGSDPTGFVAPAWLFNRRLIPALRDNALAWTEDHWRIYDLNRNTTIDAPVITWATRTLVHRWGSAQLAPALLRRWRNRPIIRIAVHPCDFDDPSFADLLRHTIETALADRVCEEYDKVLISL